MDKNKNKFSYGICCFRYNFTKKKYEVLLIKKRYTYAYVDFIRGIYQMHNHNEIQRLFNEMTVQEKIYIDSRNFDMMWYHLNLVTSDKIFLDRIKPSNEKSQDELRNVYLSKKQKFERFCKLDNGTRINNYINNSTNIDCLWEIPKGRKSNHNETDLTCAIREFTEETTIQKDQYNLIFNLGKNLDKFRYNHKHRGVEYNNFYYAAVMKEKHAKKDIKYKFNENQIYEIFNIKFMTIDEIKELNEKNSILKIVEPMLKIIKRRLKIYSNSTEDYREYNLN